MKNKCTIGLLFLFLIVGIPLIIDLLLNVFSGAIFNSADNSDWLGFWGGYLGSVIVMPLTLYIAYLEFKNELTNRQEQWKIDRYDAINEATVNFELFIQGNIVRYDLTDLKYINIDRLDYLKRMIQRAVEGEYFEYIKAINLQLSKLPKNERKFLAVNIEKLQYILEVDTVYQLVPLREKIKKIRNDGETKEKIKNLTNDFKDIIEIIRKASKELDKIENLTDEKRSIYLKE
ncbi:hypothetical protein [Pediococcus pentosaceus]|uniref:hypothetical protein n=1 Tax=Pediococcus pentosaceus TaxID=1255 RepID=UPI00115108C1|nr:hypothetical protein [Pediococcus pentosaceus]MBF7110417.1 hypothetical protein [Pediococcus pentosaceus]QDJ23934.1 hypothetical protein CPU08_02685 [Pediococcus pentosaceus]QHM60830.1 hypothetical protein C7M46_01515 [Pediococcus pentosaceus]QQA91818.1 hypothetical protein I6H68_05930 [Pediococcus pentosaceus]